MIYVSVVRTRFAHKLDAIACKHQTWTPHDLNCLLSAAFTFNYRLTDACQLTCQLGCAMNLAPRTRELVSIAKHEWADESLERDGLSARDR